jgi:hypothetical protein
MKLISRLCWLLVGGLFIFSGLIKINDPVGTAIKLEEYFEVFAADFTTVFLALEPYALYFSVILSSLEIILGVALLLRWRLTTVLWSLLGIIVFFTFLTFYSAYFNKVTDCGCFGDAIKLSPWESFTKDVVLLVMILVLLATRRYLPLPAKGKAPALVMAFTTAMAFGLGIYAYNHEPFIDFRAYKVGNHLPSLMKPSAPLKYKYVMQRNGQTEEFTEYPKDTTYKFVEMVALNPEAGPRITDFSIWNDAGDFTPQIFRGNKLLIIVQDVRKTNAASFADINPLLAGVEQLGPSKVEPLVLTASSSQDFDVFRHEVNLAVPYYFGDATVLKTMMRANPGIMLLKDGLVVGKWHHNDVPALATIRELL